MPVRYPARLTGQVTLAGSDMDNLTVTARSRVMSRIKQRDSKLEMQLRLALWRAGIRYRKNVRVHGTPDLLIARTRVVVFVDSCFWHFCRFHCRQPKSNRRFWNEKLTRNRKRDVAVTRHYRHRGWIVLRFWEHQLKNDFAACVRRVVATSRRPRTVLGRQNTKAR